MKYIIIVITAMLLSSCADKIYNTTTTINGGARLFEGLINYRTQDGDIIKVSSNLINIDNYLLSNSIQLYTITFWSRDTLYGFDTSALPIRNIKQYYYNTTKDTVYIQTDTSRVNGNPKYFKVQAIRKEQ